MGLVFHQGFNLYNIGFTSGIIGMVIMSIFRAFGYDVAESTRIVATGYNLQLAIWLVSFFTMMLIAGLLMTNNCQRRIDFAIFRRLNFVGYWQKVLA